MKVNGDLDIRRALTIGFSNPIEKGLPTYSVRPNLPVSSTYTVYVRTDGNDSNDGSANNSGNAFLTLQRAVEEAYIKDLRNSTFIIQLGNSGTYAGCLVDGPFVSSNLGFVRIVGDVINPENYIINSSIGVQNKGIIQVSGLDFTSSDRGLFSTNGSIAEITGNCIFGSCSLEHMYCSIESSIAVNANYTIDGGATSHMSGVNSSLVTVIQKTVTLIGTPNFSSSFASVTSASCLQVDNNTYSGSATGARYFASENSVIETRGQSVTYFPGNSSGSLSSGGVYT